jgi:NADH:ubiquinone reductase (H+-translocating)
MAAHRIAIVGGGFGGVYTALELEKLVGNNRDVEITLISHENFFLFTPMLHEVAASDLDLTTIVNPIRKMLRKVNFIAGEIQSIDLDTRKLAVLHGLDKHEHVQEFDQVVLSLGCTTNFFGMPGLEDNAITMKSLEDAVNLRNRLIAILEEADTECGEKIRKPLLTFVTAGGGFAGVETLASINDFLRDALKYYRNIKESDLRVVLIHPGDVILPELGPELGAYTQKRLQERGIEVLTHTRVTSYDGHVVRLNNGMNIETRTLIWTAGTTPHAMIGMLPCKNDRGRLVVNAKMEVEERPGVWALGDCALVPDLTTGKYCPPTAQHALRQARTLARNVVAHWRGGEKREFKFKTIGQLASIGHRTGVARVFGVNFSGFIAWWMWRTIYLSKLPRFEKKLRVALDWTLDMFFSKDLVQFINFGEHGTKQIKRLSTAATIRREEETVTAAQAS